MNDVISPKPSLYRIGAVSKLSGIPVPTLRIWQSRYQAFAPSTTQGQHRLYDEQDLRKAALLKRLTGQGHSIGLIAAMPLGQLQQLLDTGSRMKASHTPPAAATPSNQTNTGGWVVIGQSLAQRLQSPAFTATGTGLALNIQQVWADLSLAKPEDLAFVPDALLVSVNGLNATTAQHILALSQRMGVRHTVVLYSFGQGQALAVLDQVPGQVHRVPLSDLALRQIIRQARQPLAPFAGTTADLQSATGPRRFSDAVLQRVANIPSEVLCECPRHVAELIGQLAQFEDYSRDCLSQSPQDAELHKHLHSMAATARAMFEQALQMVASHEGISLQEEA